MQVFKQVTKAEQFHCCKALACLSQPGQHPQPVFMMTVSRRNGHVLLSALCPLPSPRMAQPALQLLGELDSPNQKITGSTEPVKTAASGGTAVQEFPIWCKKPFGTTA